ncbi:DUF488 family protein (plasmid) [Haloferacaceae archaeon DSL9]
MASFYTIGHSSRSMDEFLSALCAYEITAVVDVRRFPGSERNPQFNADVLAETLDAHGIAYDHLEALGGRRSKQRSESPNIAWDNDSFRAYADYALSETFQDALDELTAIAREETSVLMCAEAVYWRCHRRIIADWLVARGHEVTNIFGPDRASEHELTRFAEIRDGRVAYPGTDEL